MNPYVDCGYCRGRIVKGYEGGKYVRRCGQCHRVAVVPELDAPTYQRLPRYVQVANLRATGMSLVDIARELNIAPSSVSGAWQRAKRKSGENS